MAEKTNIILLGFMGSGKTVIGRQAARLLDFDFADTDEEIKEITGMDLPKLYKVFYSQGSSLFWVQGGEGTSSGEFPNRGQNPPLSTPTLGIGSLRQQAPGSPPFIPLASCPGSRLGPHRGAPGRPLPPPRAPGPLTLRCPRCTSSPRGGAAGTAVGKLTPDSRVPG